MKKQKQKLTQVHVRRRAVREREWILKCIEPDGWESYWYANSRRAPSGDHLLDGTNKRTAIAKGREIAQKLQPSSLVVHKKNGEFQAEYTYPSSRDPRKSRG